MQNRRKLTVAVYCVLSVALTMPFVASACSIFHRTVRVGPQFRVRVRDHGRPIDGLLVMLYRIPGETESGRSEANYALTDKDGYARFSNLEPGTFFLTADHDASADGAYVKVIQGGADNITRPLQWPNSRPLRVQSVSGVVRTPDFYPNQVQNQLSVALLEGISGRVLETVDTDSNGRFKFDGVVSPGTYFLRVGFSSGSVHEGRPLEGLIPIEVNQVAKQKEMDLDLGWTSCGLTWAEGVQYPELTASQVCGDIVDAAGASVSNAQVMLLGGDDGANVIEQTRSANNGQFSLEGMAEGATDCS